MAIRDFDSHSPDVAASAYVDEAATVIGQVSLGADSSVWPQAVIRGDVNTIRIGARSNIQDGTVVHCSYDGPYLPGGAGTVIGDDVTVGHLAMLHGCTIGNRCLIGMKATVMDRAVIEDEVMLAAGSLVPPNKRLESGYLYQGSPAQKKRPLTESEKEYLQYSAQHYQRLSAKYKKAIS
ncbi:MAG: gamma carbonic anhydrase family protein [Gammaproteobacteria bacterium]|nr:gamma carbonic anhydrase family protein [Gammaproteobacteria bacterium]